MKTHKLIAASIAVVIYFSLGFPAKADLFDITHTGRGSGDLDGNAFGPTDFVITARVDTNDRESIPAFNVFTIDHIFAQIELVGIGTFDFTSATRHFVNQDLRTIGLSRAGPDDKRDLFGGSSDAAFSNWDMLTEIGPISGNNGRITQWNGGDIQTSGGILNFNDGSNIGTTFSYTAVPEPSAFGLILLSLVGLCFQSIVAS